MAVYDNNTAYHSGVIARAALKIGNAVIALRNAIVDWNAARVTQNELSKLSNRELEDIGLCRADIAAVARQR